MKKIIILIAVSMFTASSAFAATGAASLALSITSTGLTVYGGKTAAVADAAHIIGKTSTGVGVGMLVDANAGAAYSVETQHKNGTKAFGTAFDSTSIYSKEVTAGTVDGTKLTTGSDSFPVATWTTM